MARQKIIRTGGSLAVVVPSEFVKILGIKAGQTVSVEVQPESGKVIYRFSGTKQLPLSRSFLKKKKN